MDSSQKPVMRGKVQILVRVARELERYHATMLAPVILMGSPVSGAKGRCGILSMGMIRARGTVVV